MKKSFLLSDDAWTSPSFDDWGGAVMPAPAADHDGLIFDGGEPFALAGASVVTTVSINPAKPVAAISTLADYLVNGFWQYNNALSHHWASNTITYNINGLNTAEQFLAQSALQAWHEVANVNFVQTTGAANITFSDAGTMQAVTNAGWYSNGAMASATVDISQDWITNDGGAMDGKTGIDSYGYQTYIHEIGHALGLGHQGPYNGSASYSTDALYADDTWQYSIMSYFAENNYSGSTYRYVVTPQMADIYAVATMYGAASTTRTGDTVYGFNSNAGAVYNFSAYSSAPALTIYDSGGNDTLDCSGYSAAQTIDLHPGAFSSVGGLVHNIGIALNTTIENAIGGSGNDTLIAGDGGCTLSGGGGTDTLIGGAGNDRLAGGAGVDAMTGNGGADTFVFAAGGSSATSGQHDRITDFVSGVDKIDVSAIDAIVGTGVVDQFHFIAGSAFDGGAGELDYFYNSALGVTTLQGDVNGDRVADFAIDFTGNILFVIGDLIGAYSNTVLLAPTTARAVQGGAAVGLLNAAPTIVDATSTTLSSATIKVSAAAGNIFPGDELYINGVQSGTVDGGLVTVSWNDSTKILTLSGTASIADYQTLLSQISYQWTGADFSTGAHTPHTVTWTVNDGTGSFAATSVITIERPPVASVANVVLNPNATTVAASSLLTASDPDGDAIANYAFKDTGSGHFYLNGVAQPNNQEIDVTAAQLSQLTYQSGGGADSVQVRVNDGTLWSSWQSFTVTAPAATVIESAGSTSLVQIGNNYYLDGVSSGVGPELKIGGVAAIPGAGQFVGWAAIGAVQTAGGYNVVWKAVATNQFSVWTTDSNGNFASSTGTVAAISTTLENFETTFQQDLNGDGTIGVPAIVVPAIVIQTDTGPFGSTSLTQIGDNYYLYDSSSSGPVLKMGGVAVVPGAGQFVGWAAIGAVQTATGYDVAWKAAGSNQYSVWTTDSNGNFASSTGAVAATSGTLVGFETIFHQDLNGDGTIGAVSAPGTVIQTDTGPFGSTSLTQVGNNYYLYDSSSSGPVLKMGGVAVVPGAGQFTGWAAIGAIQTASGYDVAWKAAGSDQYSVWTTDGAGNFLTSTGAVSATSATLVGFETIFHQDLNGDGAIGAASAPGTVIQTDTGPFGSTSLTQVGNNYYLYDSSASGPVVKIGGAAVTPGAGQFAGWAAIGAIQTASGYDVAWKAAGSNQYSVWTTDSNGNFLTSTGAVASTSVTLENYETTFHQDLNGDGTTGIAPGATATAPLTTSIGMAQPGNDTFVFNWEALNAQGNAGKTALDFEWMAAGKNPSLSTQDQAPSQGHWLLANDVHDAGTGHDDHGGAAPAYFHFVDTPASHFLIGG